MIANDVIFTNAYIQNLHERPESDMAKIINGANLQVSDIKSWAELQHKIFLGHEYDDVQDEVDAIISSINQCNSLLGVKMGISPAEKAYLASGIERIAPKSTDAKNVFIESFYKKNLPFWREMRQGFFDTVSAYAPLTPELLSKYPRDINYKIISERPEFKKMEIKKNISKSVTEKKNIVIQDIKESATSLAGKMMYKMLNTGLKAGLALSKTFAVADLAIKAAKNKVIDAKYSLAGKTMSTEKKVQQALYKVIPPKVVCQGIISFMSAKKATKQQISNTIYNIGSKVIDACYKTDRKSPDYMASRLIDYMQSKERSPQEMLTIIDTAKDFLQRNEIHVQARA